MDLTPEQLELADFTVLDDGGFAADEVRKLLRQVAEQLRGIERDGVRGVADSVGAVLDQAVKSGDDIVERANTDADAIRQAADADATRIRDDAAEVAAKTIAEGEKSAAELISEAKSASDQLAADTESSARKRSAEVISKAQQRLDRLLAAERDVHDRLTTALSDIHESLDRAGIDQTLELALTVEDPEADGPESEANWADDDESEDPVESGDSDLVGKSA